MISMSLNETANVLGTSYDGPTLQFEGCSTDSRTLKEGQLFIAISGERFDGHDFMDVARQRGAVAAIVEREADQGLAQIKVENTRKAMGELARYWRSKFTIPLVAITGSNGKTTVKEMLSSILGLDAPVLATQGNLNNDIGVPLTLFGLDRQYRYAVIEMGANHPGEISWLSHIARPSVAVITQCAPAHLEGFGSVAGVARAKAEIYEGLEPEGIAVINNDDEFAPFWYERTENFQSLGFGIKTPADISADDISYIKGGIRQEFKLLTPAGKVRIELALPGRHNIMNALAAAACAHALNFDLAQIKRGLEKVMPVKGRLQPKPGMNGSTILDDTYNANPASLQAGVEVLQHYSGKHWLILGDMGELGEESGELHSRAGQMAKDNGIERLFALGPLSREAARSFDEGAEHFNSSDALIDRVKSLVTPDVTLLVKGSRAMQMERIVDALQEAVTC